MLIFTEGVDTFPTELDSNKLPAEIFSNEVPTEASNCERQVWPLNYGKDYQGVIVKNSHLESDSPYFTDIFTDSYCAFMIIEGYVMAVKVYFMTNRHMLAVSRSTVGQLTADTSPTLCQHFTVCRSLVANSLTAKANQLNAIFLPSGRSTPI